VESAQAGHRKALASLSANLEKNQQFTGWNGNTYNLTQEYLLARRTLDRIAAERPAGAPYRLNHSFIFADPYQQPRTDIDQIIPEPVTEAEWEEIYSTLLATGAVQNERHLQGPFGVASVTSNLQVRRTVQKRVKRLVEDAQARTIRGEAPHREMFQGTGVTPLGELAFSLSEQVGRCIDGLQEGLNGIEAWAFDEHTAAPAHMGEFISKVAVEYRIEFIRKHGDVRRWDREFPTMTVALLRQKMLYSMGLPGHFAPLRYAGYDNTDGPWVEAPKVMERFLKGGSLSWNGWGAERVDFAAYDADKLIALLEEARERAFLDATGARLLAPGQAGARLSFALLRAECVDTSYAPRDPVLGPKWIEFETEQMLATGNEFFQPARPGQFETNIRPTKAFWLHVLSKYGYITTR
jgi:hypothetical protein